MTHGDAESNRINERISQMKERKDLYVYAIYDPATEKWMARTEISDIKELNYKAAEGVSLKEALMNLADKLTV